MKYFSFKLLGLVIAAVLLACASSSNIKFKPGTYQGTAPGFGGDVTMEVTVDAGKILSVDVISQSDTPEISELAYQLIPQAIVDRQTLVVDIVAGATYSSRGIINATAAALEKSGVDIQALRN